MATRSAGTNTGRGARRTPKAADAPPPVSGGGLLQTLKALGKAPGQVVTRHNRLFETLLGIDPAERQKAKDLFKLPTFEDLFDERVARSLERLGTTQALTALLEQLAAIDKRLRRLERLLEQRTSTRAKR